MTKKALLVALYTCISCILKAQDLIEKHIKISLTKTTSLIFDSNIDFFDIGSEEVAIRKAVKPHIILLKAGNTDFTETNLTVLTESGQYYSFILNYTDKPDTLHYFFHEKVEKKPAVSNPSSSYLAVAKQVLDRSSNESAAFRCSKAAHQIGLLLKNIYVQNKKLYFHLILLNNSSLDYDIDFIKFLIKNKKKLKKATDQQEEVIPIYAYGNNKLLPAHTNSQDIVLVFEQFTILDDKILHIELGEKNGHRNLSIQLKGSMILKAKTL